MNKGLLLKSVALIFLAGFVHNFVISKPSIAIVSLYDEGYSEIGKYSELNKIPYAKRHGYDLHIFKASLDLSRPPAWSKILALEKLISKYDWLYWSDADSLIMNHAIKLEGLIDEKYDIIITKDFNDINTGSFFIKNTTWARELLKRIYARVNCINHVCWEQQALIELIKEDPYIMKKIKIIPQRLMNSYVVGPDLGIYKLLDFVLHFPGVDHATKKVLIRDYYNKAIKINRKN